MKKTVKFSVEIATQCELETTVDVPEEFINEDGNVFDGEGLCNLLNNNAGTWYEIVPVFEEVVDKEVLEILDVSVERTDTPSA